jgi:hypothetical protein
VFAWLLVLNVGGLVVLVASREFSRLWLVPVSMLGTYWFAVGAWRRTAWGEPAATPSPPGPPELSQSRATVMIFVAIVAAAALIVAVVAQILTARAR